MSNIDFTKKGLIVIGAPRSGSHMTCDMLYRKYKRINGIRLGEITELPIRPNKFVFCSLVQHWCKNLLAVNVSWTKDYHIVNLRRRDKVAQYISWCIFRSQIGERIHSPNMHTVKAQLPWDSTKSDIEWFISEQNLDFAFPSDEVLYYEDVVAANLSTSFNKNEYNLKPEEVVTNYELVKTMLEPYSYDNR